MVARTTRWLSEPATAPQRCPRASGTQTTRPLSPGISGNSERMSRLTAGYGVFSSENNRRLWFFHRKCVEAFIKIIMPIRSRLEDCRCQTVARWSRMIKIPLLRSSQSIRMTVSPSWTCRAHSLSAHPNWDMSGHQPERRQLRFDHRGRSIL